MRQSVRLQDSAAVRGRLTRCCGSFRFVTLPQSPTRILLIQIVKLGDVLLSSALLDDLHRAYPAATIDVLTGPAAAPLLAHHPLVHRVLEYAEARAPSLAWGIRRHQYDLIVDVQSSAASAPLLFWSGARTRVGWGIRAPWVWAYTDTLPRGGREPEFVIRERRRLLETVGIPVGTTRPRLFLTPDERERAAHDWRALGLPNGRPMVGITLSGSVPMKDWPIERWAELCDGIAAMGAQPAVLLSNADAAKAAALASRTNAAVLVPPRDLRAYLAMLPALQVYVSPDTGPAHFAMALGVPTVTLYTPGNAVLWNPGDADTIAIEAPSVPPCPECAVQPLSAREKLSHHCMPRISVPSVLDGIRTQLARSPRPDASAPSLRLA